MKITVLLAIVVLASCSAPKYSYYFDHHNYNAGKKQTVANHEKSTLSVDPQMMVASISAEPVLITETKTESAAAPLVKKTYLQMNKSERKELRNHLKKEIKTFVADKKKDFSSQSTKAGMDHDLKLAIIFGAIGLVSTLIGGNVFYIIGGIAWIIGIVFFVKWIIRQ